MDSSWDATWALFHRALEMDAAARAAWLQQLAQTDPAQAAELQGLLAAHARSDALLDHPLIGADTLPSLAAGDRVGVYVLLREIGRGGMGTVYEAARDDGEYRHRVALKLVAPERMQPGVLTRFRRERQIMAGLEHPHIARLLDGGTTAQGWPFLVMEFVDGEPIDRWCTHRDLALSDRLQLIERIAEAVDYAHRHLVVHRDIKPGNVLVDAQGRPVLLDFGIAKLMQGDIEFGDATVQIGARAMTPRYASPEQLRGGPVSTATDVYALGVLIYELIAGTPPYREHAQSPERLAERIEQDTPPALAQAARRQAQQLRRSDPDANAKEIQRLESEPIAAELDWIVRKAMAPSADQRYPSALALADELRRLRQHEPVEARPASMFYRLSKSMRRHRFGYAVAAVFVLMATIFGLRLAIESNRTLAALAASQQERAHADSVAAFLGALFELADRTQAEGRDVSAREILDRGRERLAGQQDLVPPVRARLLGSLARVYRNLGAYPTALQLLDEAGPAIDPLAEPRLHAQWLRDRGSVLELQGANGDARDALQQALTAFESLDGADSLEAARTARLLAISLQSLGDRQGAGQMFQRADAALNTLADASVDDRADCALRLGSWYWVAGNFAETARHYARALKLRRDEMPPDFPELARSIDANGALAHAQGRYDEAIALFNEALTLRRRVLGPDHRVTADTLSNLGAAYVDSGQPELAQPPLLEAVAIFEKVLPADSPVLAKTLNNLGLVKQLQRDFDASRSLFERALSIHRRALGDRHPKLAANLNNLGLVEEQLGNFDSAQQRFIEALQIQEGALGAGHVSIGYTLTNLGRLALWRGERETAIGYLQRASDLRAELPEAHPLRADTGNWLGLAYCLKPEERQRGRDLIATNLSRHSEAQALAVVELQAMLALCADTGDIDRRGRIEVVMQLRGATHPLVRFLRQPPL
jgi:serine/threonine protein kinase/Tfp pilus assembly protein PilF